MGSAANRNLVAFVLLFLVPSASSVFYDALANEACTSGAATDLPDTPLSRGYPCGASVAQRLLYILLRFPWAIRDLLMLDGHSLWLPCHVACLLLQGVCATSLPDHISVPSTTALDYLSRSIPYAGLLVEGWRQQGRAPPSALAKHWLYRASMSAQLILYVILPRPFPALEALFGVLSTAAVSVLAAWHVPHARELGASPVAHAMMHAALAAALAGHAAWGARGGAGRGGAGHGQPRRHGQRQLKQLTGGIYLSPTRDAQKATAAGQPAPLAMQHQLQQCGPQSQLDASLAAIKQYQALTSRGSRLPASARPAYMSGWRHCSLALKVPRYAPCDVPPGVERRVARVVREAGARGWGVAGRSSIEVLSVAMREGCIQLVLELVKRRPGLGGRGSGRAEAQPPGTPSAERGELESGIQVDKVLVEAVLRALQLPDAPRGGASRAGELGDREQVGQQAEAASDAAVGQGPGGVTWRMVRDNGSSPLPAEGQQDPPVPSSAPSLARLVLEPRLLLLAPQQQQQQQQAQQRQQAQEVLSGQDQELDQDPLPWGLFRVVSCMDDTAAAADDVHLDQQLASPPEVWVRRGGRFLPVRVRQLQQGEEEEEGAGGEEAGGAGGGGGGGGGATGGTVLEVQLVGQPPAAGVAMVDLVWPCGVWRCVPLLLTRQEALAAEVAPALGLPYGGVGVRQDDDVALWQDEDDLVTDLGIWEEALDQLQGDGQGRCGGDPSSLSCPLDPAELRVLGEDLVAHAKECGWGRTAAWVRQGLGQLQGREEEGQQGAEVAQGGERAAASPRDGGLRRRPGAQSREEGGAHEGSEAGTSVRAGAGRAAGDVDKHTAAKAQGSNLGAESGEQDGGSSPLEQAFHVAETLLLLLLVATRGIARPALLTAQYLSMGPGALITLSRLLLPHATWSKVIAWYRQPRYYLHFAGNLLLLLPQVPSFSPEFLRGPSVAVYEGMLLPLCCTLPTRRALWAMVANGAAFALLIIKLEVAAGQINPMHALMRAAVAGVSLLALGMLCTVWRNSSSRAAARVQGRGGATAARGRTELHGSHG